MKVKVLIVEDHVNLASNIVRYLGRKGVDAIAVRTSIEAKPRLLNESPDWLVLDINLPDANGLDFYATLRLRSQGTKVILMSGYIDIDDRARANQLGIDHLLVKPFPLSMLHSIIQGRNNSVMENNL